MKRFCLFAFNQHYPGGGMGDYIGAYESLAEAIKKRKTLLKKYENVDIAKVSNDGLVVVEPPR